MARIRTIKPEFFRHEGLQDLEIANHGAYPMMVFEALWGHCDSKGRFEWKPRTLKLDILPFLPFDMAETLGILLDAGMLKKYAIDGKEYGVIETFEKHQRLSGKELTDGEKFPAPTDESMVKRLGSVGEIPESQEGNGKERKGIGRERSSAPSLTTRPQKQDSETALQSLCRKTWDAYSEAYAQRYGTPPVRNATVNAQVKQFAQRIGEEGPEVIRFYLTHGKQFYVANMHQFGHATKDAEKLRTEWATGKRMTDTSARQADRTAANAAACDEAIAILRAEGNGA